MDPNEALKNLTEEYEKIFVGEMREIGCDTDDIIFVKATAKIPEMQSLIRKLLDEKIAYVATDGVYFSIKAYAKNHKYGQLSKISVGRSRIDNDEYDKDAAGDFALWKKKKPGEPSWDFRIDGKNMAGRPGWNMECSAISTSELGQPFDIHTGGVDLIFPHHENEIAQSTAGAGCDAKLANYWFHNEHLMVDGTKMSKSKNNFYKLSDIEDRDFRPLDFRMLVLSSSYRKATNFTWEALEAAHNRLNKWKDAFELTYQTEKSDDEDQLEAVNKIVDEAIMKLMNDLDTPGALAKVDEAFALFDPSKPINHLALTALAVFVSRELGISVISLTDDISDELKDKIAERDAARAAGDYDEADAVRDELERAGVAIDDTASGTFWHRI
jgi:cysteinyl-tRNA synthetase